MSLLVVATNAMTNVDDIDENQSDDSGVNMLEDAFGILDIHLETVYGNHHGISYECNEEPKGNAAKFYRLLKEYQEPLTANGTTMTKLSYIV